MTLHTEIRHAIIHGHASQKRVSFLTINLVVIRKMFDYKIKQKTKAVPVRV